MIDVKELREAIANMTSRQALYRVLKEELSRRGYWKNRKRGRADTRFFTQER